MNEILKTLSSLVEKSIVRFSENHRNCRFALDCNVDYGNVIIAADDSPEILSADAFLNETEEYGHYSFGDWPLPDVTMSDKWIEELWERQWTSHETVIRDEWLDLSEFEQELRKKRFLEGACSIAADLSSRLDCIVPPILVADHDECIRHTTVRMRWAFLGAKSPAHSILADGSWKCEDEDLRSKQAFFRDGTFIDHIIVLVDDTECCVEVGGDWDMYQNTLVMIPTHANLDLKEIRELLWKEISFEVTELNDNELQYQDAEGTYCKYKRL